MFCGVHRLGDGSRHGRMIVLDRIHDKWSTTFDKQFFGSAWVSDLSHSGRLSILIDDPLYWRAAASWTDIYDYQGGKWQLSNANHRSFYAGIRDELKRELRKSDSGRLNSHTHRAIIKEAIARADTILRNSKPVRPQNGVHKGL